MLSPHDLMGRTLGRTRRSTSASTSSSKPVGPLSNRRRLMPEQIQALQDVYERNSHPSKEERAGLARQLNLELKAINVWYQNKRRSMKKKSLAWSKASSENHLVDPLAPSKSQFGRAFSLDLIVSSRELRDNTTVYNDAAWSLTRPPLTPRRNRTASRRARSPAGERPATPGPSSRSDQTEIPLWEHIPSSPLMAPSSPSEDAARFAYLPPNSKMLRSLEYACAKDRLKRRRHLSLAEDTRGGVYNMEDADVPGLVLDDRSEMTVEDTDELITPDNSVTIDPTVIQGDVSPTPLAGRNTRAARRQAPARRRQDKNDVQELPAEDVEAAMALLGFSIHKL